MPLPNKAHTKQTLFLPEDGQMSPPTAHLSPAAVLRSLPSTRTAPQVSSPQVQRGTRKRNYSVLRASMATLSRSPCLRKAQRPEPAAGRATLGAGSISLQRECPDHRLPGLRQGLSVSISPAPTMSHSDRRTNGQEQGSRQEPNQTGSGEEEPDRARKRGLRAWWAGLSCPGPRDFSAPSPFLEQKNHAEE